MNGDKIYVVLETVECEWVDMFMGAFSTKELAEKYIAGTWSNGFLEIREVELDDDFYFT